MKLYQVYSTTKNCTDVRLALPKEYNRNRRNFVKRKTLLRHKVFYIAHLKEIYECKIRIKQKLLT